MPATFWVHERLIVVSPGHLAVFRPPSDHASKFPRRGVFERLLPTGVGGVPWTLQATELDYILSLLRIPFTAEQLFPRAGTQGSVVMDRYLLDRNQALAIAECAGGDAEAFLRRGMLSAIV
ncbi:hypothetical protein AB1K56_04935 [Microbacterium sp. BWR-S6Y]|uniref:hypothetical protein n=1 Tax=Microbacterium sp. BWR-S6Y TaxID=3232073 RepID=UPI003529C6EE